MEEVLDHELNETLDANTRNDREYDMFCVLIKIYVSVYVPYFFEKKKHSMGRWYIK